MPSRDPTFPWPSRRERILALTSDLVDDLRLDRVDLNEIDGEFYWKICRDDIFGPLSGVAAAYAPRRAEGRIRIDEVDADLNELAMTDPPVAPRSPFLRDYFRVGKDLPEGVVRRLLYGVPIPMREPMFIFQDESVSGTQALIYSRSVIGDELDKGITAEINRYPARPRHRRDADSAGSADTVSLHIDFALVTDPDSEQFPDLGDSNLLPFIVVTVPDPLPPEGVIARAYDAIVREQHRWHLDLPGSGTKQEADVALRTWAIALLMAGGERFMDAQGEVELRTGHRGVTQTRFGQDRARLIERVPEAEPYLYARGDRSKPLVNP